MCKDVFEDKAANDCFHNAIILAVEESRDTRKTLEPDLDNWFYQGAIRRLMVKHHPGVLEGLFGVDQMVGVESSGTIKGWLERSSTVVRIPNIGVWKLAPGLCVEGWDNAP